MERYSSSKIRDDLDPLNTRHVALIWFDTGFLNELDEEQWSKLISDSDLSIFKKYRDRINTCAINPKDKDKYLLFVSKVLHELPNFDITYEIEFCGCKFTIFKFTNYNLYDGKPEYQFILRTPNDKCMGITYLNDMR